MGEVDIEYLRGWIGRTEIRSDTITESLVERFRATVGAALWSASRVPLGLYWCLCQPALGADDLGPDGHPARGGFLPPVPLQSRMWAGGELTFFGEFTIGDRVTRSSRIADVTEKAGRSGELVFVTVEHAYEVGGAILLRERQDIVYRQPVKPVPVTPAEHAESDGGYLVSGPVQLFRYSALTFNGHRIHYDGDYARDEEGYPGLVVHGPLQATLILNMAAAALGRPPANFRFRGLHPLIGGEAYRIGLGEGEGWCEKAGGTVTMRASFSA